MGHSDFDSTPAVASQERVFTGPDVGRVYPGSKCRYRLECVAAMCAFPIARMSVSSRTHLRISVHSYVRHQRSSPVIHVDRLASAGSCGLNSIQIVSFDTSLFYLSVM
jgi:hypothetical protein